MCGESPVLDTKPLERLEATQAEFIDGISCLTHVLQPSRRSLGQLLSQEQPNPGGVELKSRDLGELQTACPMAVCSVIPPPGRSIHPEVNVVASTSERVKA